MSRRYELLPALALAGCNAVFGLERTDLVDAPVVFDDADLFTIDRDRDGIADDMDSCVASIADLELDWDGDSEPNKIDKCAFDYGAAVDSDSDGINDDCDPFPALGGDRVRCLMTFASAPINRSLWIVRAGEWNVLTGALSTVQPGTVVAALPFEAPVSTSYYAVVASGAPLAPAMQGAATLWVRTNDVAVANDVGCEVRGDTMGTTLTLRGVPSASVVINQPIHRLYRLHATVSPLTPAGMANVRCTTSFLSSPTPFSVSAEVGLPAGRVGFTFEAVSGSVSGLLVVERDDAPSL